MMPRAALRVNNRLLSALMLGSFFLTLGAPGRVLACLETPANPPDVWISGDACLDGGITVVIHDYSTFAASDDYCACALNIPLLLGTVSSAEIVHSVTGAVLSDFDFTPNPNANFSASPDWQGFSAEVSSVVAGQPVDLRFTLAPGDQVRCEDLAQQTADLLGLGGDAIGTGGADENGVPSHHVGVLPAGSIEIRNSVQAFGIEHLPLGDAELGLAPEGLTVSGITDTGRDGVRASIAGAISWESALDIRGLAAGAGLGLRALSRVSGSADPGVAAIGLRGLDAAETTLQAGFEVNGGAPLRVIVESNGGVVGEAVWDQATFASISCFLDGLPIPCGVAIALLASDFFVLDHFWLGRGATPIVLSQCEWRLRDGEGAATFEVSVGGTVLAGDTIRVQTIPVAGGAQVDFAEAIEVLVSGNGSSLVITDEIARSRNVFTDGFESGDTSGWSDISR